MLGVGYSMFDLRRLLPAQPAARNVFAVVSAGSFGSRLAGVARGPAWRCLSQPLVGPLAERPSHGRRIGLAVFGAAFGEQTSHLLGARGQRFLSPGHVVSHGQGESLHARLIQAQTGAAEALEDAHIPLQRQSLFIGSGCRGPLQVRLKPLAGKGLVFDGDAHVDQRDDPVVDDAPG